MGQFCNRDSIPIVTILPYKFKDCKRLNEQKKRRNFYGFLCIIHEQKPGVRPPEPFGSGLWDSVLEKSVVLFQQDRQCSFGFFILRRNIHAPVKIEHRFAIPPQGDFRGSAFLISKNGRLLVMFHPVVKSARSYLNCSLFFPPVFVVFAFQHDVYYHKPKEKSTKFPAYSAQRGRQKIVYDTNQKSKPHVALCGAFVGKGKPLGGNKTTPDKGNTAAVRAAAPFGALVLGYGFWITVRSGTPNRCPSPLSLRDISPPRGESPIQIRRRFRTPHRKGHRHRFPFP